jgi:hypothetical protein
VGSSFRPRSLTLHFLSTHKRACWRGLSVLFILGSAGTIELWPQPASAVNESGPALGCGLTGTVSGKSFAPGQSNPSPPANITLPAGAYIDSYSFNGNGNYWPLMLASGGFVAVDGSIAVRWTVTNTSGTTYSAPSGWWIVGYQPGATGC